MNATSTPTSCTRPLRVAACFRLLVSGLASWVGGREAAPHAITTTMERPAIKPYDYTKSTAQNFGVDSKAPLRDEFLESRRRLDYNFHARYSLQRQELQDSIVREILRRPSERGGTLTRVVRQVVSPITQRLSQPEQPWAIFTAGCMGAGKTHVMNLLDRQGLLPLGNFARVDLDRIRMRLPETRAYMRHSRTSAGQLTQAEAGTIAEIATEEALRRGLHVWVDSSLKDHGWWTGELKRIRATHPRHRLGVIYVTASWPRVLERVARRGRKTGRAIPQDLLREVHEAVPAAIGRYRTLVDETVQVDNDGEDPRLASDGDVQSFLRLCREAHHDPASCSAGPFAADGEAPRGWSRRVTTVYKPRGAPPFAAWTQPWRWFAGV